MKKILSIAILAFVGFTANAQSKGNFKVGAHVGLPVGDASNLSSFAAGVDLAYQWNLADAFKLGVATGFQNYFSKSTDADFKMPDINYIPLAATAQYSLSPSFFVGADLGYAFPTDKGSVGSGIYFLPKLGYQAPKWESYVGYRGISDNGTISSVGLGFNYKF